MRRLLLALLVVVLAGCGGPAAAPEPKAAAPARPAPADESRRFAGEHRVKLELVPDHLFGKPYLPGGNLAEYDRKGKRYQQFLIRNANVNDAALLLFEWKSHLKDAKYLPHFGGYFGTDDGRPVFVFQKGPFVAGMAGLSQNDADLLARDFAARLN